MPLDTELVNPFTKPHECRMWDSLQENLSAAFRGDPEKSLLLGNFNCGRQIDACLVTPRGVTVIELKNYTGQLYAPLNGAWFVEARQVNKQGQPNPMEQVRDARFVIAKRLRTAWSRDLAGELQPKWQHVTGRAVFNAGTVWEDRLDAETKKWFAIATLDSIASDLHSLAGDSFRLSPAQIRFIRKVLLSVPPRRIMHTQQREIMESGLEGISIGHLTLGGMVREFHEPRAAMDRSVKGNIDALIQEYPLADESGFVLHLHDIRLTNGERQITAGANYTGEGKWNRLVNRMRIGVYKHGDACYLQLGPAVPKPDGSWSNRSRSATQAILDEAAGLDVFQALRDLGAIAIGTKAKLVGATSKFRNALCVLYPEDKPEVGLAAYVLTTVLPLMESAEEGTEQEAAA
jgi:hypothetical protein